ncbi:MAG: rhomboid family intramembrane serine protease [bacterium]
MFILIPISHEDQVVKRMPYVTIFIIALNVLIFIFTTIDTNKIEKVCENKFNAIIEYYYEHPGVNIKEFLSEEGIEVPPGYFPEEEEGDDEYYSDDEEEEELLPYENDFAELIEEFRNAKHSLPYYKWGIIPKSPKAFNYLSSLFVHGDFFHLLFNMLFLWLVGCNIEDRWGRPLFIGFYLVSGFFATFAHILMFPNSPLPLIGASGAIAGAMGAFMIKMYKTKIKVFYLFFLFFVRMGTFEVSTFVALPFWIAQQLYYALSSNSLHGGGVAFWAHIGGFIFGAIAAVIMSQLGVEEEFIQPSIDKKISFTQNPRIVSSLSYYEQGNVSEAIKGLNFVLSKEPRNIDALTLQGRIYLEQGMHDDAIKTYETLLYVYLHELKDEHLALDAYLEMKDHAPDLVLPPRVQINIAHLLEKEGKFLEAMQAYIEVIDTYPSAHETMRAILSCGNLCLNKLEQPMKAQEMFTKGKELCGMNPEWLDVFEDGLKKATASMAGE